MASNFDFMTKYWPDIAQMGKMAELYLYADANACIFKIGVLAERIAQEICQFEKIELPEQTTHADRIRALKYADILPKRIDDMFYTLRKARNDAVHMGLDSQERAASLLQLAFNLCCWMMEVYGDWEFSMPEYVHPEDKSQSSDFVKILEEQEEKINALIAAVEAITTAASTSSKEERAEKADKVAKELPLTDEETDGVGDASIRMDVAVLPVINYAMQQNGAVAIQSITIENNTDSIIEDVEISITSTPGFAIPFSRHVDHLPANKTITITRPNLILNANYLAGMTEKVSGVLHVSLKSGENELFADNVETTILAFDEWHGLSIYPELLATFVTPNHPELAKIIARATEHLGQWTGDTSMDAYQSQDPNRVLNQAAAIFTAIKEQAISYVVPPASFERVGQRVRLCDMVLQQKLGTCLDLTLLYASCLEAVGLHPILISTVGHIFTGVWLEEKMFPESVQDDYSLITKRLASGVNEIAVVETTCVTTGKDVSFDTAKLAGEQNLTTQQVEYIIDVHRARMSGISPLPQRVHSQSGWEIIHDVSFKEETMSAPTQLDETIKIDPNAQDSNLPKKVQWERKLLDLGMRNTLINLRMTKTQLPILTSSLDALENALADGSDFTILPKPSDWRLDEFSFEALHEKGATGIVKAEFENKRLRSVLTEGELSKAIKGLYRTAKAALEENGANTLYLALGMLRWYESKRSTKPRYAPVILVPIEMVRKSAAQGYVIRLRDDEPQMNITLLEKLKQDFGIIVKGVDPLPADEHGIDIRRVLTILRKAVMEQAHWDVLETASIGIFSFSQFVMWNDIRNRTDDLMRNKVVRSLIEGRLTWDAQPLEIGDHVNEDNVLLPMPADASQLYAIQAACREESFVLHGPPGTGKSQTITSLIANALAAGKSVLFVAEKMAALEVVQKRLESVGIGPFCLELHSNKSKKKDVLEQLRKATEVTKTQTAEEYAAKAEQLAVMRAELDSYAQQLHKILNCGSNLYSLINEYELYKDAPDIEAFDREFIRKLNRGSLEQQQLVVERMVAAAREVKHPHNHPLQRVSCTQYTQSIRASLQPTVKAYLKQISSMQKYVAQFVDVLGEKQPENFDDLQRLSSIASNMACWYDMPNAWSKVTLPQQYFENVRKLAQHAINANGLEAQLLNTFDPSLLSLDGAAMFAEFVSVSAKWLLPKMLGLNKLAKTLSAYAKAPVDKEKVREYIVALRDYQQEKKAVEDLLQSYGPDLGVLYSGKETNWKEISQLATVAQNSAQTLYEIQGNYDLMHQYCGNPELRTVIIGLWSEFAAFAEAKNALDNLLGIVKSSHERWLDEQYVLGQNILAHADELKEWIAYSGTATEARNMGLSNLVDCYEGGAAHDEIYRSYKKAILQGLISDAIDEGDSLNQFSCAVFNKKIEQYKRMDQEWTRLSQQEAYCRLASKVPNFTREAAHSSELGILQRCIKSGGRGTSIRKLFDQIPNLLSRLCPCMLMSPISAAQYLDPKREPFDIVVFDEASQLPTCKAVGVLARGKDAIIVGDPKQMPPTSFFATNTVDEDNLEAEDLESILDDCLALNMPQSHLLWHYRSRHESLIAFSNSQFYENKLFTFPSVNDRESKVQIVYVDGVFDRGKTRTNKAEAEAVVAEIKRRFGDSQLSKQSVGIVTFNISQQHLIDDLLTEACTQDPELEAWAFNGDEPLFIKNLENVQGDERDVILFSIGFGPDENGKIYMNFGPLNREGGWRRLNVAVSRARCEMKVFSTMRPDQLDLNRTKAEGVAALRSFLEYAEGRTVALDEAATQKQLRNHAGIADAICNALKAEGYETDLSVGRSEYRIDIGVVDPEHPDQYILGIMLDGSSYGAAKTTRDREIAQVNVLNGLGWNIHRVWCMDWWDNSAKELNRIMEQLHDVQNGKKDLTTESTDVIEEANKLMHVAAVENALQSVEQIRVAPMYVPTIVPVRFMSADAFIEPWNERDIQSKISLVVQTEAPLSLSMLTKRVVQSYGIARAGSRIQAHMNAILRYMNLKSTRQEDTVFYWMADQDPDAYIGFRASGEGENHRDVRDVPVQEVANAVCAVLYEQISMGQEDLLRETAKKLGYTRLGGNVLSVLALGIQYAQKCGRIEPGNNGALVLTKAGMTFAEATVQTFLVEEYPTEVNIATTGGAPTAKATTRKTLTWDEYYSKLYEWSESTMASRVSALTSIGKHEEVFEVIGSLDNEAGALKLVKKALELGLRFSLKQITEIECYLSAKGAVQLVESLENVDELRDTNAVCDVIEDIEHEEAKKALVLKVVTSGVKFRLADAIRIVGFIDEESCELMVRNLREEDYQGGSSQLCEAARELEYDSCCELFIQLAMQKGIRFDPADIVDMDGYIDGDLLGEMVQTSTGPFTKSQLEEIQYSLSKDVRQKAARRSQVTLD